MASPVRSMGFVRPQCGGRNARRRALRSSDGKGASRPYFPASSMPRIAAPPELEMNRSRFPVGRSM